MEKSRVSLSVYIYVPTGESGWVNLLRDLEHIKIPLEVILISRDSYDHSYKSMCSQTSLNAQWLQVQSEDPIGGFWEASLASEGALVLLLNARHRLLNVAVLHRDIERLCKQSRSIVGYVPEMNEKSLYKKWAYKFRLLFDYMVLGWIDEQLGLLMHRFTFRGLQNKINGKKMLSASGLSSVVWLQRMQVVYIKRVLGWAGLGSPTLHQTVSKMRSFFEIKNPLGLGAISAVFKKTRLSTKSSSKNRKRLEHPV